MRLRLAQGTRVIVRPSGTEPKLKCYLEVVVPGRRPTASPAPDDVEAAQLVAAHRLADLKAGMAAVLGL